MLTFRKHWAHLKALLIQRVLRRPVLFRDRYGLQYRLEPTDDLGLIFRHGGWFEAAEQEFVRQFLQPGMTAFDVGAYIGFYTCLMARILGPSGYVHAFEPSSRSFTRLEQNVFINRLGNAKLNRLAVTERLSTATLQIYAPPFESLSRLSNQSLVRRGVHLPALQTEEVSAVSLDEYCREHHIRRVDLLKIDAEGAELAVLDGSRDLLERRIVRCLLVEFGDHLHAIAERLTSLGYRLFIVTSTGALQPAAETEVAAETNLVAVGPEA